MVALVCHPDAMTPDGNPLLGPMPGTPGFWMAAGLSLNGFGGAGGIGKAIAEWMSERRARARHLRHAGVAVRRRLPRPGQVEAAGREVYRYYYRLRYPHDHDEWGRPNRLSALHGRMQDAGAVFGVKNGWERADHVGRAGPGGGPAPTSGVTAGRAPPWFDAVAEEHARSASGSAMIDMTSFGKIEVTGPGALPLLERVVRQPHRPRPRERRLHAVPEQPRRHRRRRHRHAAWRASGSG